MSSIPATGTDTGYFRWGGQGKMEQMFILKKVPIGLHFEMFVSIASSAF